MLPVCQQYGMGVLPWSPLAGGWLSGKWRKGRDAPASHRADRIAGRYDLSDPVNQHKLDAAEALAQPPPLTRRARPTGVDSSS